MTDSYPLLPLRDIVVFPHMIVPLFVGRSKSIKALEYAEKNDKEIFLVAQKDANVDEPGQKDIYDFVKLNKLYCILSYHHMVFNRNKIKKNF